MKNVVIAFFLIALQFIPLAIVRAERSDTVYDAARLVSAFDVAGIADEFVEAAWKQVGIPKDTYISPEEVQIIKDELRKFILLGLYKKGSLVSEITQLYHEHYTKDEIHGLILFFESDLGQKYLMGTDAIGPKIKTISDRWANDMVETVVTEHMRIIESRGYQWPKEEPLLK
jgi:hypothetical protein